MTRSPGAPDSPVALAGYRIWGITATPSGPKLQSTAAGFLAPQMPVWEPLERFSARCLGPRACADGDVPNPGHACGIYLLRDLAGARRWAAAIARSRVVVVGRAHAWGTVVECSGGYRAEHAYPEGLIEVVARTRRARRIAEGLLERLAIAYRIPLVA